jgi:hypothetical protein
VPAAFKEVQEVQRAFGVQEVQRGSSAFGVQEVQRGSSAFGDQKFKGVQEVQIASFFPFPFENFKFLLLPFQIHLKPTILFP